MRERERDSPRENCLLLLFFYVRFPWNGNVSRATVERLLFLCAYINKSMVRVFFFSLSHWCSIMTLSARFMCVRVRADVAAIQYFVYHICTHRFASNAHRIFAFNIVKPTQFSHALFLFSDVLLLACAQSEYVCNTRTENPITFYPALYVPFCCLPIVFFSLFFAINKS